MFLYIANISVEVDFLSAMLSNASLIFTRFSLSVLDHDFTDQDIKNIERIYTNMLMTTKSQEQQKALLKKYLGWVSRQPKRKTSCCIFHCCWTKYKKAATVPVDFKLNQGLSTLGPESRENRLVPALMSVNLTGFAGRASMRKRTNTVMKPAIFKVLEPSH